MAEDEFDAMVAIARRAPLARVKTSALFLLEVVAGRLEKTMTAALHLVSKDLHSKSRFRVKTLSEISMESICRYLYSQFFEIVIEEEYVIVKDSCHVDVMSFVEESGECFMPWLEILDSNLSVRQKLLEFFFKFNPPKLNMTALSDDLNLMYMSWLLGFRCLYNSFMTEVNIPDFKRIIAGRIYLEVSISLMEMVDGRVMFEQTDPKYYQDAIVLIGDSHYYDQLMMEILLPYLWEKSCRIYNLKLKTLKFHAGKFCKLGTPHNFPVGFVPRLRNLVILDLGSIASRTVLLPIGRFCSQLRKLDVSGSREFNKEALGSFACDEGGDPTVSSLSLHHLIAMDCPIDSGMIVMALKLIKFLKTLSCNGQHMDKFVEFYRQRMIIDDTSRPYELLETLDLEELHIWPTGNESAQTDFFMLSHIGSQMPRLRKFTFSTPLCLPMNTTNNYLGRRCWSAFANLTDLHLVSISGKELTQVVLSNGFSVNLIKLGLDNRIGFETFHPDRQPLNLYQESLVDLAELSRRCPNLESLTLTMCNLTLDEPTWPGFMDRLTELHVTGCLHESSSSLVNFIGSLKNVKEMVLVSCVDTTFVARVSSETFFCDFSFERMFDLNPFEKLVTIIASTPPVFHRNFVRQIPKLKLTKTTLVRLIDQCPKLERIGNVNRWTVDASDLQQIFDSAKWVPTGVLGDSKVEEVTDLREAR